MEGLRLTADDLKAEGFPQGHGTRVGADDEVELHAAIAELLRVIQGVSTHGATDTATRCSRARHVAAIANVLAAPGPNGPDVIGADDLAVLLGDEGFPIVPQPIGKS